MFDKLTGWAKGWRTTIFNVAAAMIPILSASEFKDALPPEYLPYYILGIGLINVYLRYKTDTAIGKKTPDA